MDEIPEDVMKAAEDALDMMLCNCKDSLGSHAAVRAESIKDIARAIMAERERCAEIADGMADAFDVSALRAQSEEDIVAKRSAEAAALGIAKAIRGVTP